MGYILLRFLFGFLSLFMFSGCVLFAGGSSYVAVAYYSPRNEYKHDAERLFVILNENKIDAAGTESAGATISVPARQAARARKLISDAIKKEKLHVSLYP